MLGVVFGLGFGLSRVASAQGSVPSEYQVKSAFLYNFTKFVEWPAGAFPGASSPFIIGVVGNETFEGALEKMQQGKSVNGRDLVVKRFKQVTDIGSCQVLFVSDSEKDKMAKILERLGKGNTLTVGDNGQFIQRGGMINFVIENKEVHFEINPDAAERAGLKISSRLLGLAKVVRPK